MRVRLVHHAEAQALGRAVTEELERRGLVAAPAGEPADVALVLVGRSALVDGLGPALRQALDQGVPLVPVLVDADVVPPALRIAKKHLPLAPDAAAAVRHVLERRAEALAGRLEGKKELLGQGLLLALLAREAARG